MDPAASVIRPLPDFTRPGESRFVRPGGAVGWGALGEPYANTTASMHPVDSLYVVFSLAEETCVF